ncbi:MAG: PepSY domain-containing protein [Alcanivorax sp.]|uniref:PepSY domain-containing protein n=1 Tax=Alloalcanivorax marinus TaxID=1177169 RepID=UPI00195A7932|nr:PepSY domain-containing protein [Alloalcanivorax marinus]MBM7334979.1 PepSY domain-containing protein [Alloalcanivorax marinus]
MNATKTTLLAALITFTGATTVAHADDVRPDQVVKLVNDGTIQSFDKLNQAALANHPDAKIEETELEDEYGRYIYQVELRDAQGQQWDVELDATNAEILREERDD